MSAIRRLQRISSVIASKAGGAAGVVTAPHVLSEPAPTVNS
jgi:hypothetical protein